MPRSAKDFKKKIDKHSSIFSSYKKNTWSIFTMSSQVYADKWEWLSKQSNWRKILNDSGLRKIKRKWTVSECIGVAKVQFPNTLIPWNAEDQVIFQKKQQKNQHITFYKKQMAEYTRQYDDILFQYRYISDSSKYLDVLLEKGIHWEVYKKSKQEFQKMFSTYSQFVEDRYNKNLDLHPTVHVCPFGGTPLEPDENVIFSGVFMNLGMWIGAIHRKSIENLAKLELYLNDAIKKDLPVKLPTLPKHICQEYFDFAKMSMIEKKCIVCMESENMLLSTCGHVICQDCFIILKKQPEFKCPECRTIFKKD